MDQVDKVLKQFSELSKADQVTFFFDVYARLQNDIEQIGMQKISEEAFADWDNEEDDVYNDL